MNWTYLRSCAWVDTRARFVTGTTAGGTLLDLGSSDGQTLGHMAELRPDLHFFATDMAGTPEHYPAGCQFQRADLEQDRLPWAAGSMVPWAKSVAVAAGVAGLGVGLFPPTAIAGTNWVG